MKSKKNRARLVCLLLSTCLLSACAQSTSQLASPEPSASSRASETPRTSSAKLATQSIKAEVLAPGKSASNESPKEIFDEKFYLSTEFIRDDAEKTSALGLGPLDDISAKVKELFAERSAEGGFQPWPHGVYDGQLLISVNVKAPENLTALRTIGLLLYDVRQQKVSFSHPFRESFRLWDCTLLDGKIYYSCIKDPSQANTQLSSAPGPLHDIGGALCHSFEVHRLTAAADDVLDTGFLVDPDRTPSFKILKNKLYYLYDSFDAREFERIKQKNICLKSFDGQQLSEHKSFVVPVDAGFMIDQKDEYILSTELRASDAYIAFLSRKEKQVFAYIFDGAGELRSVKFEHPYFNDMYVMDKHLAFQVFTDPNFMHSQLILYDIATDAFLNVEGAEMPVMVLRKHLPREHGLLLGLDREDYALCTLGYNKQGTLLISWPDIPYNPFRNTRSCDFIDFLDAQTLLLMYNIYTPENGGTHFLIRSLPLPPALRE